MKYIYCHEQLLKLNHTLHTNCESFKQKNYIKQKQNKRYGYIKQQSEQAYSKQDEYESYTL